MAVSFTQGNDFIVPTEDGQTYLGGAGNDTYMISAATVAADAVITITDTEGTNNIQLVGGLSITSSSVTSNALQLTLSNGAVVQILGADTFGYDVGGNAVAGVEGTAQTFTELVEDLQQAKKLLKAERLRLRLPHLRYLVDHWVLMT